MQFQKKLKMYFLGVAILSSVLGLIIVYVDYKQRATQSMRERIMGALIASSEKESPDLLRKAIEDLNTKINEEIQALTDDAISIENITAAYIEELKHNQERDFAVLENSTNKERPLRFKKRNLLRQ